MNDDDDYEMNEYDDENEEEYVEQKELDYNFKMSNDYYDKPLRMPDFDFSLGPSKSLKPKKTRDVIKKGAKQFGGLHY